MNVQRCQSVQNTHYVGFGRGHKKLAQATLQVRKGASKLALQTANRINLQFPHSKAVATGNSVSFVAPNGHHRTVNGKNMQEKLASMLKHNK